MDDTNKTCRAFLNDLSSASPTPGGGGAAALCGAVGAALCGMVAHLYRRQGVAQRNQIPLLPCQ